MDWYSCIDRQRLCPADVNYVTVSTGEMQHQIDIHEPKSLLSSTTLAFLRWTGIRGCCLVIIQDFLPKICFAFFSWPEWRRRLIIFHSLPVSYPASFVGFGVGLWQIDHPGLEFGRLSIFFLGRPKLGRGIFSEFRLFRVLLFFYNDILFSKQVVLPGDQYLVSLKLNTLCGILFWVTSLLLTWLRLSFPIIHHPCFSV